MRRIACATLLVLCALPAVAGEPVDHEPVDHEFVNRLRWESFHHSEVMDIVTHLTDVIGPRLTGSPGMKAANEWTRDKLAAWGLANAHLESWGEFGRGWSHSRCDVRLISPREMPLIALPRAWTPGTEGPVSGAVMRVDIESEDDFEELRGTLAGKILLLDEPREITSGEEPAVSRRDAEDLEELTVFHIPGEPDTSWRERYRKRVELRPKLNAFLVEEQVVATVSISSRDGGVVRLGGGGDREPGSNPGVPAIAMAAEQYNYLTRLAETEEGAELELNVEARFHDEDYEQYNTIAEIPGKDLAHELVMLGAHLDSWHPGTGATDNAAGSAVMMEAVRLLKALGVEPRRTIRIALWSGEEQGLFGSRGHVEQHFATRPEPTDPEQLELPKELRDRTWPILPKPDHEHFSSYFNMDNGTGRIRGVYTQENTAVAPIFAAWLEPFHDLEADTVSHRNTGGTDHLAFDAVGLPGFQFIQDRIDYSTRTHHTNMDVLDHIQRDDLVQAATIIASFVYHAAMRDEKLPRKPLPRDPEGDD